MTNPLPLLNPNHRINPDARSARAGYTGRCRRAARVGNGEAKLPLFSSLLALLYVLPVSFGRL